MNANGQPFNVLKNPLAAFLTRVVGKGRKINTRPVHDASGEAPNPVGVSTGFKGFWAFDGTTDEVQHLSGLGCLVSDEPHTFPHLDYGYKGSHFGAERWFWTEGRDGSTEWKEDLEPNSWKVFVIDKNFASGERPTVYGEMDYDFYFFGTLPGGGTHRQGPFKDWPMVDSDPQVMDKKTYYEQEYAGVEDGRDCAIVVWMVRKNYFRHVCDRLLIAQNCRIEPVEWNPLAAVVLKRGKRLAWHAPQTTMLPLFHGRVRGWKGPACDIKMPWKSLAEEKAKEDAERYEEDESDSESVSDSDSDSGDMGTIQFHTLPYANFIPIAIHQHQSTRWLGMGHTSQDERANPGFRQMWADEIIAAYQSGSRKDLPKAWGISRDTPVYRVIFKTPQEDSNGHQIHWENEKEDGETYSLIKEESEDAEDYVLHHKPDKIIYWNEVPQDGNTATSANLLFGECFIGYYWKPVDPDGWKPLPNTHWLWKDEDNDGQYNPAKDRKRPKGEWVPYDNVVNKLFYCGPVPVRWEDVEGYGDEAEASFIHGVDEGDDYFDTVGEDIPVQDKLSIPLGAAFDLMALVEAYEWVQYVLQDQSYPDFDNDENGNESDRPEKPVSQCRWTVDKPYNGFYRRVMVQARIVKPIPPEEAKEEEEGGNES